jgi:hypothetical protein
MSYSESMVTQRAWLFSQSMSSAMLAVSIWEVQFSSQLSHLVAKMWPRLDRCLRCSWSDGRLVRPGPSAARPESSSQPAHRHPRPSPQRSRSHQNCTSRFHPPVQLPIPLPGSMQHAIEMQAAQFQVGTNPVLILLLNIKAPQNLAISA